MRRILFDIKVPMRDGVKLSADVYLPDASGQFPVLLVRTPYNKALPSEIKHGTRDVLYYVDHGYGVVMEDVRGRGDSEGIWHPFINDAVDGFDTVEWIAKQEWCNGKIGMLGGSYRGWVQWAAAKLNPPHLVTLVSTAAAGRWFKELPYYNGLISLGMLEWLHFTGGRLVQNVDLVNWNEVLRKLPLKSLDEYVGRINTVWRTWISHSKLDDYWLSILLSEEDFKKIDLPVLHITGWYDGDQPGATYFYEGMMKYSPAKNDQYLISGPWDHGGTRIPKRVLGGVDFGPEAVIDLNRIHLLWFDWRLKDDAKAEEKLKGFFEGKRALTFVMGENRWAARDSWPPAGMRYVSWYLHSGGAANTLLGDGRLSLAKPSDEVADTFQYDPNDPVISAVDFNFYSSKSVETPLDSRFIERRDDVLVYTSDPLTEKVEVAGKPKMSLYASSDRIDTDWIVLLSDVHPDGRSIMVDHGGLRARFRESFNRETFLEPGNVYRFDFDLFLDTDVIFPVGHRIRLSVMSSLFPRFDRNPNDGLPIGDSSDFNVATNRIYHEKIYPSALLLPTLQ